MSLLPRVAVIVLVASLVAFAGCSGGTQSGEGGATPTPTPTPTPSPEAEFEIVEIVVPEEVERIERNKAKDTFGNLTILTEKLNQSQSNAPWGEKREKIDEHSILKLNRELLRNWYDQWNEETISDRGERLSEIAAEVWPSPDARYWD